MKKEFEMSMMGELIPWTPNQVKEWWDLR